MRILIVIQSLGPGGTERTLLNTLPALNARGHDCVVASLGPPYDLESELLSAGIEVIRLGRPHRWDLARAAYRVADIAKALRCDILHGKLYFSELAVGLAGLTEGKSHRTVSFHNMAYGYAHVPKWKRKFRKTIEAVILRARVDTFSAISTAVAKHFETHLRIGPVEVIHNPVPSETLVQRATRTPIHEGADRLCGDESLLVVPARLSIEKGHRYLLDALAKLKAKHGLKPRTVFYGAGPLLESLTAQAASLGLSRQIAIDGVAIQHDTCLAGMQAASAVVLPSTHEAFGLAAAEAMALGTPVVASAVGGYLDVIEDGSSGILVPAADSDALAEALRQVLTEPDEAARLRTGGPRRVAKCFSVAQIADCWEAFYERTCTR